MTGWPSEVAVAIPTVAARSAAAAVTISDWRAVGADPFVSVQPDAWPIGHASHRRHVDQLLARVLDDQPDARWVLLTEDDVDVDPAVADVVAGIVAMPQPPVVTLWANGTRHYPKEIRDHLEAGEPFPHRWLCPVRALAEFHGSLAVLMTRDDASALVAYESPGQGWDIHLRTWLLDQARPLHAAVPNLVQHRGVPSLASRRGGGGGKPRSVTWRWPVAAEQDEVLAAPDLPDRPT